MRKFSIRPTLTIRGRAFKGLRGWSGKPLHPPLTDFPVAAYVLAAVFDVISVIGGQDRSWAGEFWHAGTYTFIGGAAVSVFAALTGLWDAWKSSEAGTQARRTINTHATVMVSVTVLALADIAWRLAGYHTHSATPGGPHGALRRHRPPRLPGRHLRRCPRLRVRLQRRNRGRPPGLARLRDRRAPRPPPGRCRHLTPGDHPQPGEIGMPRRSTRRLGAFRAVT